MFTEKQASYLRDKLTRLPEYINEDEIEKLTVMLRDATLSVYFANEVIGAVMHLMKPLSFTARIDAINALRKVLTEYKITPCKGCQKLLPASELFCAGCLGNDQPRSNTALREGYDQK